MNLRRLFLAAGMAAATGAGHARAAEQDHHAEAAAGGEWGRVAFATSCAPQAQGPFETGVAKLHSFEPAVEDFRAAAMADPGCAIAHWGAAMSARGNPLTGALSQSARRASAAHIRNAKAAGAKTARERAFISALDLYLQDYTSHADRTAAYEASMAAVARDNPGDTEVQVFHALAVLEAVDLTDKTYARQLRAGGMLERLWAAHPDHPGAPHYIIHGYDYAPLAARGLTAARRYAAIAPASVHARHMSAHIFTILGLWPESIAANHSAAVLVDPGARTAAERDAAFLHGFDFIAYARLQLAQDRTVAQAMEIIRERHGLPVLFQARYALERGDWRAAAQVPTQPSSPLDDALGRFARAVGRARLGDAAAARAETEALKALRAPVLRTETEYWAGQVDVFALAAEAWTARAEDRPGEALALMRRSADLDDAREKHIQLENKLLPMRELYGEMLLELGRTAEALSAFEASLQAQPNRYRSIAGAMRAAEALGRPQAARRWAKRLADLTASAEAVRPEMTAARSLLGGS